MYEILKNGGLNPGGLNFDAKVRRASFQPEDLFYAHIAGMDSFAVGLKVAHNLIQDGVLDRVVEKRYQSFREGIGKDIVEGKTDFNKLAEYALKNDQIENESGHQELIKATINQYLLSAF